MKISFDVEKYIEKIRNGNNYFHTFINRETLAAGVLLLKPGEEDTQEPHQSDEVYFILQGDGFLRIKEKDFPVSQNKIYFVGKNTEHYFHGNARELVVLYFFGGPDV